MTTTLVGLLASHRVRSRSHQAMQRLSDWNHFGNWSTLRGSACVVSKETSGFCGPQLSKSARIRKFSAPLGTRLGRVWPNIVCWPVIWLVKAPRARILSGFLEILTFAAEYWMDLGKSTVFQGRALIECVWRIHNDILKIWNFNDPLKVSRSSYSTLDLFRWYISSYFRERFFSQKWSSSSNRYWVNMKPQLDRKLSFDWTYQIWFLSLLEMTGFRSTRI